jgi:hypothetical protein
MTRENTVLMAKATWGPFGKELSQRLVGSGEPSAISYRRSRFSRRGVSWKFGFLILETAVCQYLMRHAVAVVAAWVLTPPHPGTLILVSCSISCGFLGHTRRGNLTFSIFKSWGGTTSDVRSVSYFSVM